MKMKLMFSALLLLVVSFGVGLAQNPEQTTTACSFSVQRESVQPTITGPDKLAPMAYVVEQPDSPLEVLSVDLTGMWLSLSHERHTEHFCAKHRVRNRSDQTLHGFEITLMLSTIAGAGGGSGAVGSSLAPGQATDVESCGVNGDGSAKDNYVRLLVYVNKVDFEDCHYKPSIRIPRTLNVHTVW